MSARRPLYIAALVALFAPLFSSCAVGPRYHQPAAPSDAGYSPAPLPAMSASVDVQGGEAQRLVIGRDIPFAWWERFGSPQINSLVERAFQANPTIPTARAALKQAQELVYAQQGFFFPTLDGSYQFQRQEVSGNLSNSVAPGAQGNGQNITAYQNTSSVPHNSPLYYNLHTAQLTVGFVPDVFGSNRRQVESLQAQADAQHFALEATYVTLASNVVAAAIQEASLRAQVDATREIIAAEESSLRILRAQFRLGFAMGIDVAAQEATLAQLQATLPPLQKQLEQTRDLIRALVGNLPNQDVPETFRLDALQLPPEVPLSLPASLVEQRPDVRAAEAQLRSANAQVGVAIAAMLPQFSITATDGGTATAFAWMFRSGGPFWYLVGGVSQPIFEGGTLLHRKRAASQALLEAAGQYRTVVIAAYQNVADTLHATLSDADALTADVHAETAARHTLDLTHRQMEAGYVSYLALLSAEMAYQQAVLARVQAQATRYGDTVALFQALGGGWWNRPGKELALRGDTPPASQR
jgi:NodT family efflux transporter outer membrane factor (OMF) lipoprotein